MKGGRTKLTDEKKEEQLNINKELIKLEYPNVTWKTRHDRGGQSETSTKRKNARKLLKRCQDGSKKAKYETIFEAFQDDDKFRKSMIDNGHNGESIKALDVLALSEGQDKPMTYSERVAKWDGQHVLKNKQAGNPSGGSATKARDAPEFQEAMADRKALLKRKNEEEEYDSSRKWEHEQGSASSSSEWRSAPTQARSSGWSSGWQEPRNEPTRHRAGWTRRWSPKRGWYECYLSKEGGESSRMPENE